MDGDVFATSCLIATTMRKAAYPSSLFDHLRPRGCRDQDPLPEQPSPLLHGSRPKLMARPPTSSSSCKRQSARNGRDQEEEDNDDRNDSDKLYDYASKKQTKMRLVGNLLCEVVNTLERLGEESD
eukprot:3825236-Amphidinium_carterae.1